MLVLHVQLYPTRTGSNKLYISYSVVTVLVHYLVLYIYMNMYVLHVHYGPFRTCACTPLSSCPVSFHLPLLPFSPSLPPSLLLIQTHEDPNLGKVWYHGSITRDEAVDLLMKSELIFTAHIHVQYVYVHVYMCMCTLH